jgi:hypothetical protein
VVGSKYIMKRSKLGKFSQMQQSHIWTHPSPKHWLPPTMAIDKIDPSMCEQHKGSKIQLHLNNWSIVLCHLHIQCFILYQHTFQGLQNQYPTSLHILQNFEPSYFHDLDKLSELQMLLKGARKVRILRLHITTKAWFLLL